MSDKRLVGRWVFEPTGEVREPQQHEWYQDSIGPMKAIGIKTRPVYPILRVVEQPREVALPSADAVVLARKVWDAHAGWHGQSCDALHCQAARAILDAEAAFVDVVVPPPPDYNPNDVAFNRTPAPSDDAVTVAKGTADHHLLRGHFGGLADCAIPACQAAARILTEKEKSNA